MITLYILVRHFMSVIQINRPCLLVSLCEFFKVANSLRRSLESPSEKLSDVEDCQCAEEKVQTSQPAKLGHQTGSGRILQAQTHAFVIITITETETDTFFQTIFSKTESDTFFSRPNFLKPKARLFFPRLISETKTEIFFRDQIL